MIVGKLIVGKLPKLLRLAHSLYVGEIMSVGFGGGYVDVTTHL
jgi:hypothetical protein